MCRHCTTGCSVGAIVLSIRESHESSSRLLKGGVDVHWQPILDATAGRDAPLYAQLLDAMLGDIRDGALAEGTSLPPQRRLAASLGLSVGTVTRAYREAETLGLVSGHVGRGTVVCAYASRRSAAFLAARQVEVLTSSPSDVDAPVDLMRSQPPAGLSAALLGEALARPELIARLAQESGYAGPRALSSHRAALADWVARFGTHIGPDEVLPTHGAQHALTLALQALASPDTPVLVEANTYHAFTALAASLGLHTHALAMDADGLDPAALRDAARRYPGSLLYTVPTLHNPTTRTQPLQRRLEIVEIAREHGLWILEDELYRALAEAPPPSYYQLVPERTLRIVSLSKSLAPALRTGALVVSDSALRDRLTQRLHASALGGGSTGATLAAFLIESGLADQALERLRTDARRRLGILRDAFGSAVTFESRDAALHVWVPLSVPRAQRLVDDAARQRISLRPPDIDGAGETGLRLCLGGCSEQGLAQSLGTLRELLA